MYFSVAEQEHIRPFAEGDDAPLLRVKFAVSQPDTSKCVLTITDADGRGAVLTFWRNGYLESADLVDLPKENEAAAKQIETRNEADRKTVVDAQARLDDPETPASERAALTRTVELNAHVLTERPDGENVAARRDEGPEREGRRQFDDAQRQIGERRTHAQQTR